ncbi:carboxymuconolactone decarboxylase family protein [Nocardia arthritidis]|uniref:Carboxymuconolactone decarboxylase family protein n=1 Tax=Nocardia arthritidis TaxID=228602 RepID=A0A6G9YLN3_9NOCA|nr:hypothetical protein [Nocardia arthritidis]QIS14112.1 hypothetical protein F5544_31350 [Nocardia arthritidis]
MCEQSCGLGWPQPRQRRITPRAAWLRYVLPGTTQIWWIGTVHPRLLAALFALEGPAEYGQWALAELRHGDIELVVLRASWHAGHYYHWSAHALWGRIRKGRAFLDAVAAGPSDAHWNPRERLLLRAVDDLHDHHVIAPPTRRWLRRVGVTDRQLIEICFITGHYRLLGLLEESAGMPHEPLIGLPDRNILPAPRRSRAGKAVPISGLNAANPWLPGADAALGGHPALRVGLRWFGRAMSGIATIPAAEVGAAMTRQEPQANSILDRAVRELDREFIIADDTWLELRRTYSERQLLELCVLVGHFRTLEMIVNTVGA